MRATIPLILVLVFALNFLTKSILAESRERKNDKRGIFINVGRGGKVGSGGGYGAGSNADQLGQGFSSGSNVGGGGDQAGSGGGGVPIFQTVRVARPIPVPQSVPVTVNRPVPVAVPQPFPVVVPKPYAVAVPHPVTVTVPRPYPVSVPRPVPVLIPHPVPVAVPHPVGVPVPKPYPVPVPHPVPVPSPVLVGASGGGIPFGGFSEPYGGEFLNFGNGLNSAGGHGGIFLALAESQGLPMGYSYGLPESGLSDVPPNPLQFSVFEPSSRANGDDGSPQGTGLSSQGPSVEISGGGTAASYLYVDSGKDAPPSTPSPPQPPPASEVPPSLSPEESAPSGESYHYGPGYKV